MEGFGASRRASERGARGITDDLTGRGAAGESPRWFNRVGGPAAFFTDTKSVTLFFFGGGEEKDLDGDERMCSIFVGFGRDGWMCTV